MWLHSPTTVRPHFCQRFLRIFRGFGKLPNKQNPHSARSVRTGILRKGYPFPMLTIQFSFRQTTKGRERNTGAGKTTIINLLMRFYDIDSGKITIDGNDITKVTRDSLRRAFAMVLQDTWLFHGTIYENIAYGKPDATLEDVKRVCKAARIHNYADSLCLCRCGACL